MTVFRTLSGEGNMSRTLFLLFTFVAAGPSLALAQTANPPRWEIGATVGLFGGRPVDNHTFYGDDWYSEGRYAVSAGHYWTEHLKTEVEFATTGEGERYSQRIATFPGAPPGYIYGVQEFYRVQQASARMVWQFRENAWVHP